MKKILLSLFVILSFAGYIVRQRLSVPAQQTVPIAAAQPDVTTSSPTPTASIRRRFLSEDDDGVSNVKPTSTPTSTPSATTTTMPTPMMSSMMAGRYKNGRYTGPVADAFYGNVQVVATISGGRLTDVQFLDYPHDQRTSQAINSQATPLLRSQAIQAQSANVDGVSGASQTSRAFRESLTAALSQASV